jgi:hypothetical protein
VPARPTTATPGLRSGQLVGPRSQYVPARCATAATLSPVRSPSAGPTGTSLRPVADTA